MQRADIEHQAEKLHDYVRRGGSSAAWLRSKGFRASDRKAILEASARIAVNTAPRRATA